MAIQIVVGTGQLLRLDLKNPLVQTKIKRTISLPAARYLNEKEFKEKTLLRIGSV